ncbi:MAG: VWA domain-containing protein [Candidatus Riflebacteria bacterium]|nr:VWA domain-containing protein [Candidatus Riflebacteria bacterium]
MEYLIRLLGLDFKTIQTLDSVRFSLAWSWAGIALVFIFLVPAIIFVYRLENKPAPVVLKSYLIAIKILFFAGLVILLAGPKLILSGTIPEKNKIAVLIDSSKSMSISEEGISRIDRVKEVFTKGNFLEKLEAKTGLAPSVFTFSSQVAPISHEDTASFSISPDGSQTNLSRAISEIGGNLGETNLLGIVLFTDGIHNTGENPLEAAERTKVPLYFLGTGKSGLAKDISVALDKPPSIGYLNSMLKIRGEIRAFRADVAEIEVEVKKDGKNFDRIKVPLPKNSGRAPFYFNIPCDTEGAFTYTVSIPRLTDELTYENNEANFLLKIIKDRLQVLFLADNPSWDYSFIKAALKTDPNAHFTGFTRVMDNRWLVTEEFELKRTVTQPDISPLIKDTDVLIIAGISENIIRDNYKELILRVDSGQMGVLFLPGSKPYSELGYLGSQIEEWFPVELRGGLWKGVPSNFDLPIRETPYSFLRLLHDPVENQEFFRTLPKMDGLFVYPKLRAGTEVLLSSSLNVPGGPTPAFVTSRNGQGRVAMFMGGPIWPMGFQLVQGGKGNKPYTAFVVNTLKWLANRREDAQVSLELPSSRIFVGQPATLRVFVTDHSRQPVDNAQVSGEISNSESDVTNLSFFSSGEKGLYEASFIPYRRGITEIKIDAKLQNQSLGKTSTKVIIDTPTVEFDDPEVKVENMTTIASITGGLYRPVGNFAEMIDSIKPKPGKKKETKVLELRDSPTILIFLLLLPILEWLIRRRKGYS